MKKIISLVLSLVMAISVGAMATIPAMAKDVVSPHSTTKAVDISTKVNGSTSKDITFNRDKDDENVITFTYNGKGNLTGWEFPGMKEGKDYVVTSEEGNSITIELINGYDGKVVANALVDNGSETTKGNKETTKKTDKKSTSPKTGAVSAAGIAVAGAGVAMLAALKKKSSDEE